MTVLLTTLRFMPSELSQQIRTGRKHGRWPWVLAGVILIGPAGWWFLRPRDPNGGGPAFVTEPLSRGDLELSITATGNLEPTNEVTVGSELSGTVLEVYVDINDTVERGQKLALLDTTKLQQETEKSRAALDSARAAVGQAEATLRESQASLTRLRELHRISGGRTPSKAELESAEAAADRADAELLSAKAVVSQNEAAVKANESDLGKALIASPVDGIVLTRSVEPGQTVAAQFTAPELFVLAEDLATMDLAVAVSEADIGRVEEGQPATFTVDAWPDREYNAEVRKVSFGSTITDNVVTYATELSVPNGDLSLRPGMTATVDISIARRENVLRVSSAALRFEPPKPDDASAKTDDRSFVQKLMPGPPRRPQGNRPSAGEDPARKRAGEGTVWVLKNGRPEPVPVRTGLSDGRYTEVTGEGLGEGDAIILRTSTPAAKP